LNLNLNLKNNASLYQKIWKEYSLLCTSNSYKGILEACDIFNDKVLWVKWMLCTRHVKIP